MPCLVENPYLDEDYKALLIHAFPNMTKEPYCKECLKQNIDEPHCKVIFETLRVKYEKDQTVRVEKEVHGSKENRG